MFCFADLFEVFLLLLSHSLFFVMPSASWFRRIRAKRKKGQVEKESDDDDDSCKMEFFRHTTD